MTEEFNLSNEEQSEYDSPMHSYYYGYKIKECIKILKQTKFDFPTANQEEELTMLIGAETVLRRLDELLGEKFK